MILKGFKGLQEEESTIGMAFHELFEPPRGLHRGPLGGPPCGADQDGRALPLGA